METWPSILPNPSLSIAAESTPAMVRTQMTSGRSRQRRRYTSSTKLFRATWLFDDFEYGMFQSWVEYKINAGADSFIISLPTGGEGLKAVTATIVDGKYNDNHRPGLNWNVQALLEVEEALVWDETIYDSLLIIGAPLELETATANLHTLVNTTLPSYL